MDCQKCNLEMKKVRLCTGTVGVEPYVAYKEKGIFESEIRSSVECYLCTICGEVKLIATKPEMFTKSE